MRKRNTGYRLLLTSFLAIFLLFGSLIFAFATDKEEHQFIKIVVEPGDTLWKISNTYYPDNKDIRKTIYQIKKLNNISGHIYPGQEIKLVILNK